MKDETILLIVGIVAVVVLLLYALSLGYDGALIGAGMSTIMGIIAYKFGKKKGETEKGK